jgi:purine-binding chemotaxis protein CheW
MLMSDAAAEATTESTATLTTLLTFDVAEQTYGLPVTEVVRIIEMVTITHLPDVPDTVQGIINLQGRAVPVMDLRQRFGLPHLAYGLHTPIILVNMDNDRMLGLIVDAVEDVLEVVAKNMEMTDAIVPAELSAKAAPLAGVAKVNRRMILILNANGLLSQTEHRELSQALGLDSNVNGSSGDGRQNQSKKSTNNRRKKS